MNKLIITGNCGHDCNPKQVGDKFVYNLTIAVSVGYGENKKTIWYDANIWRQDDKLGTIAKGTKLLIEGEPSVQVYTTKQGEPAAKIQIFCNHFEFLSSKSETTEPTIDEVNASQKSIAQAMRIEHTKQENLPF